MSENVDLAAQRVFNLFIKVCSEDYIFDIENKEKIIDVLDLVIGTEKGKAGKGDDLKLAKGLLDFITSKPERNLIIPYTISKIEAGELKRHYEELDNIFMIGDKIASFYLRDVVSYFKLEDYVPKDDLIYLQPIDTWVKQVVHGIDLTRAKNHKEIRQDIVNCCWEAEVNPQEFNMGAWLCGAKPFNMLLWRLNRS